MTLLIGSEVSTGLSSGTANSHYYSTFTAVKSGYAETFLTFARANGHIKTNIYDASGNKLWADDTGVVTYVDEWASIPISPPVWIAAGQSYGLGSDGDVIGAASYIGSAGAGKYKAATYSTFVAPASVSSYTTTHTRKYSMYLDGTPVCAVTGVNSGNPIHRGQTGVIVSGSDFGASGARAWLTNSADRSLSTIRVGQPITAQTDLQLTLTIRQESLPAGTSYLHVRNYSGQWSVTGFATTLEEYTRIRRVQIYSAAMTPAEICALSRRARMS